MKRRPVEWLPRPTDEDGEPTGEGGEMQFRVIGQWVATDQDQLLLPIKVLSKTDVTVEDGGYTAVLKQYGGEGLLNDMLMSDQDLDRGSHWSLMRVGDQLTVEPFEPTDDS